MSDLLGWGSAAVLVAAIVAQIVRQYRERTIAGVSPWLYCGQCCASLGLLGYSALEDNWVFVTLNAAMAAIALAGIALWLRIGRDAPRSETPHRGGSRRSGYPVGDDDRRMWGRGQ